MAPFESKWQTIAPFFRPVGKEILFQPKWSTPPPLLLNFYTLITPFIGSISNMLLTTLHALSTHTNNDPSLIFFIYISLFHLACIGACTEKKTT